MYFGTMDRDMVVTLSHILEIEDVGCVRCPVNGGSATHEHCQVLGVGGHREWLECYMTWQGDFPEWNSTPFIASLPTESIEMLGDQIQMTQFEKAFSNKLVKIRVSELLRD